jgi:hypothetical protein
VPVYSQNQFVDFSGPYNYPVGYKPNSMAAGNLDNENFFLVTTTPDTNDIPILLGNAEGELSIPILLPSDYSRPTFISIGDLNRDGKSDMVLTVDPIIRLYFGDGSGKFPNVSGVYNGSNAITGTILGDFTNDGILDLAGVFTWQQNVVSVLVGDSTGSFSRFGNYISSGDEHAKALALAVGDINKDSNKDIIVAHNNPGHISVLWGDGTGRFFTRSSFNLTASSNSVAVDDLNNDGNLDIVVVGQSYDNISVLLGNGIGGFSEPAYFIVGTSPGSVVIADLNKDGILDVTVANQGSNNISVLVGDGSGSFSNPINFPSGSEPIKVIAQDFNGDGLIDLATANHESSDISILLNSSVSSVNETITHSQNKITLFQNFPNPFNPITKINFTIQKRSKLSLKVFDVLGREVVELVKGDIEAGEYEINFDASSLPSGIYIYKLRADSFEQSCKMVLLH